MNERCGPRARAGARAGSVLPGPVLRGLGPVLRGLGRPPGARAGGVPVRRDRAPTVGPRRAPAGLLAALLLVASVAGLIHTPAPAAATTTARGVDAVCPPPPAARVEEPVSFPDQGTTHAEAIVCAAAYGLVGGFGDGTYRPSRPVTRAQTSSVVSAWLRLATGFALDVPAEQPFPDVSGTHADAIAALAGIGVLTGRLDGTFGPDQPLTRGQFAGVVARAISYADVFAVDGPLPPVPTDGSVAFLDVAGTTFESDILALAGARITMGTGGGLFAPTDAVTRGQLATFLLRGADYLDRHQRWKPTARTVVLLAELEVVLADAPDDDGSGDGSGGDGSGGDGSGGDGSDDVGSDDGSDGDGSDGDGSGDGGAGGGEGTGSTDDDATDGGDGSGGNGTADGEPEQDPAPDPRDPRIVVTLIINAFNGSLGYLAGVTDLPDSLGPDARLVVRLGGPDADGPLVLVLAEAEDLAAVGSDGFLEGRVVEADSAVRFADLVLAVPGAYVELTGSGVPGAGLRGALVEPS